LNRPWQGLELSIHPTAAALFKVATESHVGRGNSIVFWLDKWIFGQSMADLAPMVVAAVPLRIQKKRMVEEALTNQQWISDISEGLLMVRLFEYLHIWDIMQETELSNEDDRHIWRFDKTGKFSSKSAYRDFFNGAITFEPWKRLWKTWSPEKCKVFLWLAIRNRCWTADKLGKRNLPTRRNALFAIKWKKQPNTSLWGVLSLENFGSECYPL
jgi:hypothetical protein